MNQGEGSVLNVKFHIQPDHLSLEKLVLFSHAINLALCQTWLTPVNPIRINVVQNINVSTFGLNITYIIDYIVKLWRIVYFHKKINHWGHGVFYVRETTWRTKHFTHLMLWLTTWQYYRLFVFFLFFFRPVILYLLSLYERFKRRSFRFSPASRLRISNENHLAL